MMYYVLLKRLLEFNMYRGGVITHNFPLKVNYRINCVDRSARDRTFTAPGQPGYLPLKSIFVQQHIFGYYLSTHTH